MHLEKGNAMAAAPLTADLIVKNARIFTGDRDRPYLSGAIAVRGNRIAAVGPDGEVLGRYRSGTVVDADGGMAHPGMTDTHLHLTSLLFHGFPIDSDGRSASKPSYASVKTETDDEITAAFTAAAGVALLRRGFTTFMEAGTVFETDAFAETLTGLGMRGLVSAPFGWDDVTCFQRTEPGTLNAKLLAKAPPDRGVVVDRLKRELRRNRDGDALVTGFVCLYGEGSSSDELLAEATAMAREAGVIYNQHQGFVAKWRPVERELYGRSGLRRLDELGALNGGTTLSHMNVIEPDDLELVRRRKPNIVWCPNNALHRAVHREHKCHAPGLYRDGLSVSLGLDTALVNSLGTAGIAGLLLAASLGDRLEDPDPFYMQTVDAARNMGLGDDLGTIEAGKKADIVVRSYGDITHTPLDSLGSALALSSHVIPVATVIIDGRIVVQDGRPTRCDQQVVLRRAAHQRERLLKRIAA